MKNNAIRYLLSILVIAALSANNSAAEIEELSMLPIKAENYFRYSPAEAPNVIQEINDISKVSAQATTSSKDLH